jgi:cyclic nucleotide-binding protein
LASREEGQGISGVFAQATHSARAPLAFFRSRAGLFVALAFLIAVQNTYASTLVASLFLARIGAEGMPFYYVLFAATSIPFAALFSSVIDRFPRPVLFKNLVGVFTVLTIVLAFVLLLGDAWSYVALLMVRVFEHMTVSLFYILFADYFTVTDAKRFAGRLALGMASGGLTGGTLLTLVTGFGGPIVAAGLTPLLVGAVLVFGAWLTGRQHPLDAGAPASRESVVESLRIIPRLMRRYPLIALMSAAMFLNILLQCLAEFLAFSIYTAHFPRVEDLAPFLGAVNAGLNVLAFLVIVLFTDRQLPRIGVPKMNRVYPALDVLTFGVLTVWPSLPAGILANSSYDPFERGVDVPVATMNYNAIRYRFVGRVRVFIDGMMFPSGLASAGVLLMLFQGRLDLRAIAAFGLALSVVLLVLHWNIGKEYVRGLIDMLRDGAVELDEVGSGLKVPPEHVEEIRAMLAGDPRTALMGLQMAARCDAELPAAEIAAALAKIPIAESRRVLGHFGADGKPANREMLEALAATGPSLVRKLAWERIFSDEGKEIAGRAAALLNDPDPGLRCVAAARVLADDPADPTALAIIQGNPEPEAALGAIEVLRHAQDPRVLPVLTALGNHADASVRAAALGAAGALAGEAAAVLDWAGRAARDANPQIRKAAFAVLARLMPEDRLGPVAEQGLADAATEVRQAVAEALGHRGEAAFSAIRAQLRHDREEVQLAAMDALGSGKGAEAGDLLFEELNRHLFVTIAANQELACAFPRGHPGWPAIRAALDNARGRTLRLVLHALEALGQRRTLNLVRLTMTSPDERTRANAIESLASLPHRRFVIPVLPLIEGDKVTAMPQPQAYVDPRPLLAQAAQSPDVWLRAAAAVAWHAETGQIPDRLWQDTSVVMAETIRLLADRPTGRCAYAQEALMSRLAFLHDVPLFAETSLDDLIAVDRALGSETYLAGEAIVTEGESGDRLCIVYRGEVLVRKGGRVLARLGPGDFFGEMALFDDEPRSATVTAVDEVEVLSLQRERFHTLVQQRPSVLMQLCTTLVRRLRQAEQEIPTAATPLEAAE